MIWEWVFDANVTIDHPKSSDTIFECKFCSIGTDRPTSSRYGKLTIQMFQQFGETITIQVGAIGKDGDADAGFGIEAHGGGKARSATHMLEVTFAIRFAHVP